MSGSGDANEPHVIAISSSSEDEGDDDYEVVTTKHSSRQQAQAVTRGTTEPQEANDGCE